MPNWCSNHAYFSHKDPAQVEKVLAASKEGKLFETFFPFPNGEWDYGWCIDNWGTKWDANILDVSEIEPYNSGTIISVSFDTAWGPAIGFYEKMKELGFEVDATYYEEGLCFAGHYTSEDGDYSVEYDFDDPDWREDVEDDKVMDILEGLHDSWLDYKESFEEEDLEEEDGDDANEKGN